jgi:hypothetical protein
LACVTPDSVPRLPPHRVRQPLAWHSASWLSSSRHLRGRANCDRVSFQQRVADGRPAYLKLRLTLEAPDDATVATLTEHVPRVTDQFNGFLREMRTDDLAGSAGAYRLRLELLRRVNLVIAPSQVNAVLIEEMLVQ